MRILGIGNALLDVFSLVEDEFPASIGIHPGSVLHCRPDGLESILLSLPDPAFVSGGGAANVMKIGAMLGLETAFSGCLGKDRFGELFLSDMERAGVGLSGIKIAAERTGCAVVMKTRSGSYCLIVSKGASEGLSGMDVDDEDIRAADWVYAEGFLLDREELLLSVLNRALLAGKKIAFDLASWIAVRDNRELALEIASRYADLVFCGEDELEALSGMSSREAIAMFRLPRAAIVLKRGASGSMYLGGEETFSCPAPQVEVLDRTAAGDAFAAGFLSALSGGGSPAECLSRGSAAAALALRVPGSAIDAEDSGRIAR